MLEIMDVFVPITNAECMVPPRNKGKKTGGVRRSRSQRRRTTYKKRAVKHTLRRKHRSRRN